MRYLLAFLICTGALGQAIERDAWQDKMQQHDHFWGSDSSDSVMVSETQRVYLHADTFWTPDTNNLRNPEHRPPTIFRNSSIGMQTSDGDIEYYLGAGDTDFFTTIESVDHVWPIHHAMRGTDLFVYAYLVDIPIDIQGITRYKITNPTATPNSWSITEEPRSSYVVDENIMIGPFLQMDNSEGTRHALRRGSTTNVSRGQTAAPVTAQSETEDYVYIYGYDNRRYGALNFRNWPILARTTKTNFDNDVEANYEYWNGVGWQTGIANAHRLRETDGTYFVSGTGYDVYYMRDLGVYIMVTVPIPSNSEQVKIRWSRSPQGPWSADQDIFRAAIMDNDVTNYYSYSPRIHNSIDHPIFNGNMAISVNTNNHADDYDSDEIYFPVFAELDVQTEIEKVGFVD